MPLSIRPQSLILETILNALLAGDIITDISAISVIRQLCEGMAATQADLEYDLYNLEQSFFLRTAEGLDLDIRGADHNVRRDPGQAASDTVIYYTTPAHTDDIVITAQNVIQATLSDGSTVRYRSLGDQVLRPSGRSVGGPSPTTTITAGGANQLTLNLDGDGPRVLSLTAQTTGAAIAADMQAQVRGLTALTPAHQDAYALFRCDYALTTPGAYTLRSGTTGPTSTCVVTPGPTGALDATGLLKLGLGSGGQELAGQNNLEVPVLCDTIGVLGNVGVGQINEQVTPLPGIDRVSNPHLFSNGREPASDDAYRQAIRRWLLALGRGTRDALEQAVAHTVSADGQQHVMSSQVVYGVGTIQVFVCDGHSLTVGAQSDVVAAVQDELDGLGVEPGGWEPSGIPAGVASAQILTVDVAVTVVVGPTPDLVSAQRAIMNSIYATLFQAPVGQSLSYSQISRVIDATVAEVFDILFTVPVPWSTQPPDPVGGTIGLKLMPGTISVQMVRA